MSLIQMFTSTGGSGAGDPGRMLKRLIKITKRSELYSLDRGTGRMEGRSWSLRSHHAPINQTHTLLRRRSGPDIATYYQDHVDGRQGGAMEEGSGRKEKRGGRKIHIRRMFNRRTVSESCVENALPDVGECEGQPTRVPVLLRPDTQDTLNRLCTHSIHVNEALQTTQVPHSVTVALVMCPADEESGRVLTNYLHLAFPMMKVVDNLQDCYRYDTLKHWQRIVDQDPCCFIIMISKAFLEYQTSQPDLEIVDNVVSSMDKPIVPVFIEDIELRECMRSYSGGAERSGRACYNIDRRIESNLHRGASGILAFHRRMSRLIYASLSSEG